MRFDDRFVRELPGDPSEVGRPRQVLGAAYSRVSPTPVRAPKLAAFSRDAAALLGLDDAAFTTELVEVLGGNRLLPGMIPYAACYGGHQFGNWAGQLGDGRAITLGEFVTPEHGRWEVQLKGAGPTPYSRTADGRAVLRSSIREFLCSEAMHHLGVPTTRALSLVTTGEEVVRDMFYDGRARPEPGAIVCRLAPSFLRFGSFELPASRRDEGLLRALLDHTIRTHFSHLGAPSKEVYAAFLAEVSERTARLMAHWMRVGFVHGVMNTDNLSILGLTIDYGPYGWLEPYDPDWTPNTTDAGGRRYRFGHQPSVAGWNLVRLAGALLPLLESREVAEQAINRYSTVLESEEKATLAAKLGLSALSEDPADGDGQLVEDLFGMLASAETDMTLFFRLLSSLPVSPDAWTAHFEPACYAAPAPGLIPWLTRYRARFAADPAPAEARRAKMDQVNPLYVLRNYLAQEAIDDAERGDFTRVHTLLEVLRTPYVQQPGRDALAQRRPEWARHKAGSSMLSCSS